MKKRIVIRQIQLKGKMVDFPKHFYIPNDETYFKKNLIIEISKQWMKADKELKKYKEFVDVILKHMNNDGWSNDYTIDFWNMSEKELKVVKKMFKKKNDVKIKL